MTRSLGEDSLGLYRLKESEQIMKATVNLNQILQGGLAGLVAWLFKTVNDLQQEVATLKAQVVAYQDSINGFNQNLIIIEEVIREILFKVGG
tara:strand:- start:309 stop:584 length:276 start_codon:yes stop_codon:yes gene_type:complete